VAYKLLIPGMHAHAYTHTHTYTHTQMHKYTHKCMHTCNHTDACTLQERGTYWGMWNIAHNLGGFAAPLIAGGFAKSMGWQWGMWAPGIIGLVVGSFVLIACK